jgi:hypothetical protein
VLLSLGFTSTKAEEDIWIKNMGDHYVYIAVYVDDMMVASKNPKWVIEGLEAVPFSHNGTRPVTYHLGCDYCRDKHGTLCVGPKKYIKKMVG